MVNIPQYCLECVSCKVVGEVMVGSVESGGLEDSHSCKKGNNMTYYYLNPHKQCSDFDDGVDYENY